MANQPSQRCKMRIQKELEKWDNSGEFVMEVVSDVQWIVHFRGAAGTLYDGEEFRLRITFMGDYPMEAPEVVFIKPYVPKHPHIYSNGHICLSILGDEWSPAQTARTVCLSILSMMSSSPAKEWPPDNVAYTSRVKGGPKGTVFEYHDDTV
jgi:ubiquitin-conjugating enzyme E2 W